ncbi:MBL fold metallo-hydrolase [Alkaliphilus sp. MSJ-5]|uniref:MBL fold metallo-hydrolase n=1 Tax=Alkaliphilus flagellatus TaxID=2841507 RepID=A0ABS6G6C2_9FIRM|nr:MBL fold metallo-hydrolase [Alkaliphilus flagellatus]MBU5676936.1 MBL fold metallo-hydrolase [Alkaliphilus flagellatus]
MNWFDINKIDYKTYVISENKHYEKTNIYFLIGKNFNVCIDSGMGLHKIGHVLDKIDNKERRVITTHSHWDHIGNHDEFDEVYFHKNAKDLLKTGELTTLEVIRQEIVKDIDKKYIPKEFEIDTYKPYDGRNGLVVEDGDIIDQGDRQLEIIHTPGHTIDSISIFEKETGYLFVGDFLYSGPLYCRSDNNDPNAYYTSLEKLLRKNYEITKILSAHYDPDLGKDYIAKTFELLKKAKEDRKLEKGSGNYKYKDMEIIL